MTALFYSQRITKYFLNPEKQKTRHNVGFSFIKNFDNYSATTITSNVANTSP